LLGSRLQGYLLIIHATFAPVFIGCTAIVALLGAGQYRFKKEDLKVIGKSSETAGCWLTDTGVGAKTGFWLLVILALPVTLTMVLSMFQLFGTDGQEFLHVAHRWSALAFSLIAIAELYILVRMGIHKEFR